jgi:hypothetical protein
MACKYYYNTNPDQPQVADKTWVAINGGIDPTTSTPEQLAAAGYYCYVATTAPTVNTKIYTVESTWVITGTEATQEYTVVPFALDGSKGTYTSEVKAKAYSILQPTDWLVVRQVENDTPIPTDWNDWRESVRLESQGKVTAIESCETADDLNAYVTSEAYGFWPPEPTTPKVTLG